MANFDWINSPSFQENIKRRLEAVAISEGMKNYQISIVDKLMEYADKYKSKLLYEERMKFDSQQRNEEDALRSVQKIISQAAVYARQDGRTLLEAKDFDKAYTANFCMVWPFCGQMS